ncbi:MAG: Holliday junction resolvase RuvX [Betaproteobacteria bacterium]|nr:Holliday junction resolvase RuvX [Betaproteobacteria bacterium]
MPEGAVCAPESPGATAGAAFPSRGSVLAFDFGLKRIGVAVGELDLQLAHPLMTVPGEPKAQRFERIEALAREWAPVLLVVGVPSSQGEADHPMARPCRRFGAELGARTGLRVVFVDETLTSAAAGADLAEAGLRGRRHKPLLDPVAAQRILETFFASL